MRMVVGLLLATGGYVLIYYGVALFHDFGSFPSNVPPFSVMLGFPASGKPGAIPPFHQANVTGNGVTGGSVS